MAAFKYNFAIVSRIPESYRDNHPEVDLDKARDNLEQYINVLRKLGIDVLELPADEKHPNCIDIDDTAIIINQTALMCNPNRPDRQGEINLVRQTLRKELGIRTNEVDADDACVEGGDVMFTGKEIIVGLSRFTNYNGAQAVAKCFPEYPTTTVNIPDGYHLKDLVCMGGKDVMCIGQSETAQHIYKQICSHASFGYLLINVQEDHAANVNYVNDTLIHYSDRQIPKAFGVFENKIDYPRIAIDLEELLKGNSTLTSSCLLVGRTKHPKKIVSTLP